MVNSTASATGISDTRIIGGSAPARMTSALYPNFQLDPVTAAASPIILPAGQLVYIPIDMTSVMMTQLTVSDLSSYIEEYFWMRGWISLYPLGPSLSQPETFTLLRMTSLNVPPVIVYTTGQPPMNSIQASVKPGQYYLNVLNLTNRPTAFAFAQINLA